MSALGARQRRKTRSKVLGRVKKPPIFTSPNSPEQMGHWQRGRQVVFREGMGRGGRKVEQREVV